jgi:hypothetical protein
VLSHEEPRALVPSDFTQAMTLVNLNEYRRFVHSSELGNLTIRMALSEAITWAQYLRNARRYLEWGSGGSTAFAAWFMQQQGSTLMSMDSVESSKSWIQLLLNQSVVLRHESAIEKKRLTFHTPDLGRVGEWERPLDWMARSKEVRETQSRSYYLSEGLSCCFDLILVDGRFRLACLLQALTLAHNDTVVLLHDVATGRGYHRVTSAWYDLHHHSGTMAVLRPKAGSIAAAQARAPMFETALRRVRDDFM